jgi:hypothetical protein
MQQRNKILGKSIFFALTLLGTTSFLGFPVGMAQNITTDGNSSREVVQELREIKAALSEESSAVFLSGIRDTVLNIGSVIATVFVALYLFRLGQETRRKNTIQRSCDTLLRELGQAGESFRNDETRIRSSYFERSALSDVPIIREIDYNRAIIVTDAYDSILHSAFFTEFSSETQHILSTLYDRIRMHNRLILSISQFEEPTKKMLEYEFYLTRLELDITTTLYQSLERVRSERLASMRQSRVRNILRLRGNRNHMELYGSG